MSLGHEHGLVLIGLAGPMDVVNLSLSLSLSLGHEHGLVLVGLAGPMDVVNLSLSRKKGSYIANALSKDP